MKKLILNPVLALLPGLILLTAFPVHADEPDVLIGWRGGNSTEYPDIGGPAPSVFVGTYRTNGNLQQNLTIAGAPFNWDGPSTVVWMPALGGGGTLNPVWFDGFDVSTNTANINFEIGAGRQGGPLVPTAYLTNTADPTNDFRHQMFGPGGGPLQLAADGSMPSPVLVSPDLNMTTGTVGEILNVFSVTMDPYANNPDTDTTYFTYAAITIGNSAPLTPINTFTSGLSVVFYENTFGGLGSTIDILDGGTPLASSVPNPAGNGAFNLQILFNDPADGDPWDGSGDIDAVVSIDGVDVATVTALGSFYTDNYITLEGYFQTYGGTNQPPDPASLATHTFDNLTAYWTLVGAAKLPERGLLADVNGDGLDDKVQQYIDDDGSAILTAIYTDCSPFNFQNTGATDRQNPTSWLDATNQYWVFGDVDADGIDDALFTTNDVPGDTVVWGGFFSEGVPGISIDQGGLTNWMGYASWGKPSEGDVAAMGEFNGDGVADRVLYRPSIGRARIDYGAGPAVWGDGLADVTLDGLNLGNADTKLAIGDLNGDGLDDLAVYEKANTVGGGSVPAGTYGVSVYFNDGADFTTAMSNAPELEGLWGESDDTLFGQHTVPPAVLTGLSVDNGDVLVRWDSSAGCDYQVWGTDDLEGGNFTNLVTVAGTGGEVTYTNASGSSPTVDVYRVEREAVFFNTGSY